MSRYFIGLLAFLFVLFRLNAAIDTRVELLQVLFRHGARTPVLSYPTDRYNETTWAKYGGFGQLTQFGMKQHYEFGNFLRDRYSQFLNPLYSRYRVNVTSTDYDRTLMSAYSLLTGLFKPQDFQKWNDEIDWQPIPVHTTPMSQDKIFYSNNCTRYLELKDQTLKSDEYLEINQKYKDLFDLIDEDSGFTDMSLIDLWKVADSAYIEKEFFNLTLPDWIKNNYDRIMDSNKWDFYFNYRTTEMARLTSGPVLKEMRNNILRKISSKSSMQLYLYSAHDSYVAALSRLLNLTSHIIQPPFASALAIELRKALNSDEYFVQVYLKNNTYHEDINYQLLRVDDCDELCPLDKFLEKTKHLVVEDIIKDCVSQKAVKGDNVALYIAVGFVSLVCSIMTVMSIVSFINNRKKYGRYHQQL